ncbi:formyltransferase family protein [Candidatus Nitrosopelagicus sp.]|nr:formyltransferase family protein [Candidatus Nitrosopelagicus sp.]
MKYVICAYRSYGIELYDNLKKQFDFTLIKSKKELTYNLIQKINPSIIFFPDWSWKVPEKIVKNFKCVCFHEAPLPKFRGGSPLQNQIIRGKKKTKTTAFIMNEEIDAGNIILEKDLSLEGSIQEIYSRMYKNDYSLIIKIIHGKYKERKQSGKPTFYKRRKPEDSELKNLNYSKKYLYNFIRMLEDPYPNAYIKIGKQKIIFKKAFYNKDKLSIHGEIQ